jgi:hypothetical protein
LAVVSGAVKDIGPYAFDSCTSLIKLDFWASSGPYSLGVGSFEWCSSLQTIHLPDGMTSIPNWCFSNCGGLRAIDFASPITEIGRWAFDDCVSLMVPDSFGLTINVVGEYAFRNASISRWMFPDDPNIIIDPLAFAHSGLSAVSLGLGITGAATDAFEYTNVTGLTLRTGAVINASQLGFLNTVHTVILMDQNAKIDRKMPSLEILKVGTCGPLPTSFCYDWYINEHIQVVMRPRAKMPDCAANVSYEGEVCDWPSATKQSLDVLVIGLSGAVGILGVGFIILAVLVIKLMCGKKAEYAALETTTDAAEP